MKLRRIINSQKNVTDWGKWKSGEKMPKSAYPLSKNAFKISNSYTWRTIDFECLGEKFRLLIAFRIDLSRFQCHLGKFVDGDMLTMARYEFHATEPGWHLHCVCDDTDRVLGTMKCEDRRFPNYTSYHGELEFGAVNEVSALDRVTKVFKLNKCPPSEAFELVIQNKNGT